MARGAKRPIPADANEDDGVDEDVEDSDDDEEDEDNNDNSKPMKKKKKTTRNNFIDDAAEESGDDEGDDDDEEEDADEDNNDYVHDGFVVDEAEDDDDKKKSADGLEDSDDENEDDSDDEDRRDSSKRKKRIKRVRVMDLLDDDDLDLIQENSNDPDVALRRAAKLRAEEEAKARVIAKNEADLRKGLFEGDDDDEVDPVDTKPSKKPARPERYDEYGMDDFIEDDIGDQEDIRLSDRKSGYIDDDAREVTEDQLNEASEIFGTDYLDFIQDDQADEDEEDLMGKKYRERGVGVSYGVDSDEEIISDEDDEDDDEDDLFGDEDDEGMDSQQKAEVLRLKREKRKLAKTERRRQALQRKTERRKAMLRRAFEPVQLVENFCTERDDDIRQKDVPERLYDWKVKFYGSEADGLNDVEEKQASWIASRIPDLAAEMILASSTQDDGKRIVIIQSIANVLRFLHRDKLEPSFIKRYRKDYIPNHDVLEKVYTIMDEDGEWDRIMTARSKVEGLLETITSSASADESAGVNAQQLIELEAELKEARVKLDDTAKQEVQVKSELEAVSGVGDDDDDDELFGGDENDAEEKKKEKTRLTSHLSTIQSLLEARADKVSQLAVKVQTVEAQNKALNDPGPVERITKKMSRNALWNHADYSKYLKSLSDSRHILDLNAYFNLIREGNDAIRKKELPLLDLDSKSEARRRSRRFDRDFYRTCVSEGLRAVCYRFLLAPHRVGIKLEDNIVSGGFDFSKTMEGEENEEGAGDPLRWTPPTVSYSSPTEFANELIGSGELVLLSTTGGGEADASEVSDPLRGCRYVAAMELASEPRTRRYLRDLYRKNAYLTTKPTKKGYESVDAFHDFYGLHLLKAKPVREHFPPLENEIARKSGLNQNDRKEYEKKTKELQKKSCIQYLNILKAEKSGDITVHIHLPLLYQDHDWYDMENEKLMGRENQDMKALLNELEKVYMPTDGDSDKWNDERMNVLRFALTNFLLPQFELELRRDLADISAKMGVEAAAGNLRDMAMEGPYRPAALLHTENRFSYPTGNLPIVGICCASDPKEATYLASVASRGETSDHLVIPSGMKVESGSMREKVIMFLMKERPAAVIVGTSGGFTSRMLQRKMVDMVNEATLRWNNRSIQDEDEDDDVFEARQKTFKFLQTPGYHDDEEDTEEWKCNVELVNDEIAQLFGRSVRGKKEFPDYVTNLKCAISLARYARDPLGELTYTWSVASDTGVFGTEMLFLNIHPMQQLLPKNSLLREYERVLCEVVSDVGADLNACCTVDHMSGYLMFVAGLGPRKAANLKHTVKKLGGAIGRRRDLLEKRLLGPIVYNNAVAFIKIKETDQLHDQLLHPLDETRLHPDVYLRNIWAVKIAFTALERDDSNLKETVVIKALRDVMENSRKEIDRLFNESKAEWEKIYGPTFNVKDWNPRADVPTEHWTDKVEDLDLDTFADMLEGSGSGRWHSHLEMIKWEFRLPFADPRRPMEHLSGDKLFHLITGESDQSVRPGKEVTGKVVRNGDFGSRVKLEGDIPAFIPLKNISDEHVESADDFVTAGQIVTAIVTEVKKDHMTVDMSLKGDDFRKNPSSWQRPSSLPPFDEYFDFGAAQRIEETNNKKREAHVEALQRALGNKTSNADGSKKGGRVVRRACTHPAFRNMKHEEVERELADGGMAMVGEAIIRPSSKASDSLAMHWVVKLGSVKVIEISEEDKETDASIGNNLKIKGDSYGSIDELLGRYIAPLNDFVEELVNYRKFIDLPEDEVDEQLRAQKKASPKSIPYSLCWMEMHPGYASLRFVASTTARHHAIGISPKGYSWMNNTYSTLDHLINAFKKNPRGVSTKDRPQDNIQKAPAPKPVAKVNRWGTRPAPPPPQGQPTSTWRPPPPPVMQVPVQDNWISQPVATGGWGQAPPPQPRLELPPPPSYGLRPPPPPRPAVPSLPPPPAPVPPPTQIGFGQSATFGASTDAPSQGRGRGRTLPAWMSKS